MRRTILRRAVLIVWLLPLATTWGQQPAQPNFSGTWRQQSDHAVRLVVEQKDDSVHITELKGTETIADYTCNTLGKECNVKYQGHAAKVSFWFNGSKLVELETRGSAVTKRRFELANGDKTINVELSSIVPEGKSEKLAFAREGEAPPPVTSKQ